MRKKKQKGTPDGLEQAVSGEEEQAPQDGGAPLLGISKPVIKAHGSSDAKAFKNAIRQAIAYADSGVIYDVAMSAQAYAERKKALREQEKALEAAGDQANN